jgi:hypothetical protein
MTQAEQICSWINGYKVVNNRLPLWQEECMLHIKEICGYDKVKTNTFTNNIYHHFEHSKSKRKVIKCLRWVTKNNLKYIDVL